MRTRPSVFFLAGPARLPAFFTACDDTRHAVNIAGALREYFKCPAWVEDWDCLAHQPNAIERKLAAARLLSPPVFPPNRVIREGDIPPAPGPSTIGDPRR